MPFHCPVEGCRKEGNLSSLRQHFGAKHPELAGQYSSAKLVQLIKTKGTIKMPTYDPEPPQSGWSQRTVYFVIGGVAVVLLAVVLLSGVVGPHSDAPAKPDAPQSRPNAR